MPWPDFFFRKPKFEPVASSPSVTPPKNEKQEEIAPKLQQSVSRKDPSSPAQFPFRRKAKMTDVARIVLPSNASAAEIPPDVTASSPVEEIKTTPPAGIDFPPAQSPEAVPAIPEPAKAEMPAPNPEKSPPVPAEKASLAPAVAQDNRPKQEFLLTNGERILGHILSETPEALYISHPSLGVLTLQRSQIAKRLVEIILINGDRIVGDVMAETADSLYVRHASLGMITVPRSQRSTHVVEAVLKDGDRILGEILAETESFTVIRSATLGTVTVHHAQVSMLNRKVEQVQLKALPNPALENATPPASGPTPGTGPATPPNP